MRGGGDRDRRSLGRDVGRRLAESRGLRARRAQLLEAQRDAEPAADPGSGMFRMGMQGGVAARTGIERAKAARNRQERVARGLPLYDRRGRYIGNDPLED